MAAKPVCRIQLRAASTACDSGGCGLLRHCQACVKSHLFNGFLRIVVACQACGAPVGLAAADDAPPYFTILVRTHVVMPLMFVIGRMREPPLWVMSAIFLRPRLLLAVGLLRPIKGDTVGLMLTPNLLKTDTAGT